MEAGLFGPDNGRWSYDKSNKMLTTITSGFTQVFEIEVLTEKELQLKSVGDPKDYDYEAFGFEAE